MAIVLVTSDSETATDSESVQISDLGLTAGQFAVDSRSPRSTGLLDGTGDWDFFLFLGLALFGDKGSFHDCIWGR